MLQDSLPVLNLNFIFSLFITLAKPKCRPWLFCIFLLKSWHRITCAELGISHADHKCSEACSRQPSILHAHGYNCELILCSNLYLNVHILRIGKHNSSTDLWCVYVNHMSTQKGRLRRFQSKCSLTHNLKLLFNRTTLALSFSVTMGVSAITLTL